MIFPTLPSKPLVSVVVANYNGGAFIGEALQSLCGQSYEHLEILVVDDCSTDDSLAIIAALGDPRIRVLSTAENSGPYVAANIGIGEARGLLIARLDADDFSFPHRIRYQVQQFVNDRELMLLGGRAVQVDEQGNLTRIAGETCDWQGCVAAMLYVNPFIHSTIMFRNTPGPWGDRPHYAKKRVAQDYGLAASLVTLAKCEVHGTILCGYRVHGQSMTASQSGVQREESRLLRAQLIGTLDFYDSWVRRATFTGMQYHVLSPEGNRLLAALMDHSPHEEWKNHPYTVEELQAVLLTPAYPVKSRLLVHLLRHGPWWIHRYFVRKLWEMRKKVHCCPILDSNATG